VIKRFMTMAGVVALLGLVVGIAGAFDDSSPSIKVAMGKLHKGGTAALPSLKKALGAPSPDWKGIQTTSKLVSDLSAAITEQDPPKGDKANYAKLSKAYADEAKKLKEAADAEDAAQAKKSLGKLNSTCKTCHTAHKGA
jgi:cytochrome c556